MHVIWCNTAIPLACTVGEDSNYSGSLIKKVVLLQTQ